MHGPRKRRLPLCRSISLIRKHSLRLNSGFTSGLTCSREIPQPDDPKSGLTSYPLWSSEQAIVNVGRIRSWPFTVNAWIAINTPNRAIDGLSKSWCRLLSLDYDLHLLTPQSSLLFPFPRDALRCSLILFRSAGCKTPKKRGDRSANGFARRFQRVIMQVRISFCRCAVRVPEKCTYDR